MGALHLLVNASDFDCQFEARMAGVLRALDTLLTVMRPTTWGFRLFDGRAMVGRSPRELVGCRGASFGPRNDEEAICSLADHVRRALRSLRQYAPAPLAAARGGDVSSHGILMRALMEVLGQVRSESEVIELDDDARADAAALVVVVAASPPNESALAQFVFNSDHFTASLPSSIEAFFQEVEDAHGVRSIHAAFLKAYGLTAEEVPLVWLDPDDWNEPFRSA